MKTFKVGEPFQALYNYTPRNEDELELRESDVIDVMEKCDDGWFVGTSRRTRFFGTFPGNYVKRLWITLLVIYAAFQQHICITLPERSRRAPAVMPSISNRSHPPSPSPSATRPPATELPRLGEMGGLASVWKCIFLLSALNLEKWMCGIRKKTLCLIRVEQLRQKISVSRRLPGPLWKLPSLQATRLFLTTRCGSHFHLLSLAVYFPFTSLPSVLVYMIWQLYFNYCLPALICCNMHSDYKI